MKVTPLLAGLSLALLPLAAEAAVTKKSTAKKTEETKISRKAVAKRPPLTSASILRDMRVAAAYVTKYARKDMNAKSKMQRPFWSGLQLVTTSLTAVETGSKKRDAKYLAGLNTLGRGVAQLSTAWAVLRESYPNSKVGRGILALQKAERTFKTHFGPQVARMKKGGAVSAKETAECARQKASVGKFRSQLAGMKAKAGKKGACPRLIRDLDRQCGLLMGMDTKGLNGFTKFAYTLGVLQESLYAYYNSVEVWYPEQFALWNDCGSYYETFASASWRLDTSTYASWDFTSMKISSFGSYYEETITDTTIEVSEELSFVEEYDEESATEEVESDEEMVAAEAEEAEETEDSLYEEVGEDDADGDGLASEEDSDDDNDGSADATDTDDDGDGLADTEDTDPDGGEMEADDADEDGLADDVDADDDNDGTGDAADTDDDGDGEADAAEPEEEMEEEEAAEEEPADESDAGEPEEEMEEEPAAEEESAEEPAEEESGGESEPEPEMEEEPAAEEEAAEEPSNDGCEGGGCN